MADNQEVSKSVVVKLDGNDGALHFVIDAEILDADNKLVRNDIFRVGRSVDTIAGVTLELTEGETKRTFQLSQDGDKWLIEEAGKDPANTERSKTVRPKTTLIDLGPDLLKAVTHTVNQVAGWKKVGTSTGGGSAKTHEARVKAVETEIAALKNAIGLAKDFQPVLDVLQPQLVAKEKQLAKLNTPKAPKAEGAADPAAHNPTEVGTNAADLARKAAKEARNAGRQGAEA